MAATACFVTFFMVMTLFVKTHDVREARKEVAEVNAEVRCRAAASNAVFAALAGSVNVGNEQGEVITDTLAALAQKERVDVNKLVTDLNRIHTHLQQSEQQQQHALAAQQEAVSACAEKKP